MKKKILFEVDFKDWAFYFMVKSWSLKLSDEYDCYYVCNEDIGIGDELMLHVGHPKVEQYYKI